MYFYKQFVKSLIELIKRSYLIYLLCKLGFYCYTLRFLKGINDHPQLLDTSLLSVILLDTCSVSIFFRTNLSSYLISISAMWFGNITRVPMP